MRKKISLYIGERLVDLDTSSLILFNYTMEDLSNPTIVKNSYSQQVTLKGTANNNAIFGDYFRLDRRISLEGGEIGAGFNASRKTPFQIFADDGSILESGYVKLDDVIRKKGEVEYKVTLYGGLGSFLYSLSYDENGNKRTLADLDYIGGGDGELDFSINATSVGNAWRNINEELTPSDSGYDAKWHTINFAPAYNGVPNGDFDAKHGVFSPTSVGLTTPRDGYDVKQGYSLCNLGESRTEWEMKDLRSYLQRPVISMDAIIDAIAKPENNGGYEVDASAVSALPFPKMWMTLPMMPSLGSFKQTTSGLSGTFFPVSATTANRVGRYVISGGSSYGSKLTTTAKVRFRTSVTSTAERLLMSGGTRYTNVVLQAVAYDSNGDMVGGSNIVVIGRNVSPDVKKHLEFLRYSPLWEDAETQYTYIDSNPFGEFVKVGTNLYEFAKDIEFRLSSYSTARVDVYASAFLCELKVTSKGVSNQVLNGGRPAPYSLWSASSSSSLTPTSATATNVGIVISANANTMLRSNAYITKKMLLSSTKTPAEYLLSFCKIFGIYLYYDNATKKVTLLRRNDLFLDETIDLTKRIDKGKDITIHPMVFDSKWYDFRLESDGGEFFDEYKNARGREYGVQRVNTGYDFDAEARNLLDGNAFKNAVTTLERGRFFNWIIQGGKPYPSVFTDGGSKYTLYNNSGSKDFDIPVPSSSAVVTPYNDYGHTGYDVEFARKLQLHDASNKPLNGENVLVFYEGFSNYPYFSLTDDISAMDVLNGGKPCWLISPSNGDGVDVPIFQRYTYHRDFTIDNSLDFGVPSELDIPDIAYNEDSTIYERCWKNYIADRYDVNTKVMTCKVNLSGLQVGAGILRKLFWYENTLWTLNKISNYSLTTLDAVECEFVQVMNKTNYINGQSNG